MNETMLTCKLKNNKKYKFLNSKKLAFIIFLGKKKIKLNLTVKEHLMHFTNNFVKNKIVLMPKILFKK